MNKHIIGLLLLFTVTTLFFACSDRGNTIVDAEYDSSIGVFVHQHEFDEELGFCMFDDVGKLRQLSYMTYIPPNYKSATEGEPYPVLYLLSPYGETEMFYFSHKLKEVADRLIGSGEIEPMIIVCVNGYNGYGGSFFANSDAGGRYVDAIARIQGEPQTGSLIDFVDAAYNTISDSRFAGKGRGNRAISGVGMGGYGAMRMAITYSENFSSVSAISAPLDFDGIDSTGGFIELFSQILDGVETVNSDTNLTLADTLRATYVAMDTSYNDELRTMMFAAATTFSPHDTEYVDPVYYPWNWQDPTGLQQWHSLDTNRITDTLTYFEPFGAISSIKYHLPFYNDTTVAGVNADYTYQPIWDLWLDNNLENILADNSGALDTTDVLLMTTADAKYNFYDQTLAFAQHLTDQSITPSVNTYSGYDGYDATGERFIYDIMEDILKYHSDRFDLMD